MTNEEIIVDVMKLNKKNSYTLEDIKLLMNEARLDERAKCESLLKEYLVSKNYPKGIMEGILNSIKELQ